jgi:hypothetical protein
MTLYGHLERISIVELIEIFINIKELACQPKLEAAHAVHRRSPEILASYGGQPSLRTRAKVGGAARGSASSPRPEQGAM